MTKWLFNIIIRWCVKIGVSVDEILNLCQRLEIKVSEKDDLLSDDDIILLDNEKPVVEKNDRYPISIDSRLGRYK